MVLFLFTKGENIEIFIYMGSDNMPKEFILCLNIVSVVVLIILMQL